MNNFRLAKFIDDGLEGHYVFYERLKDDGYEDIYHKANVMVDNASELSITNPSNDSMVLRSMAQAELSKEKAMLSQTFGCNFKQEDIENREFYKELIQLLNESLNIKKVFERNALLVQETQGQKAVFSFFGSYFEKAWNQMWPVIANEIKTQSNNFKIKGQSLEQIVLNAYDKYIGEVMILAFKLMFEIAEEENGIKNITSELQDAYTELVRSIEQGGANVASNPLLRDFYDIYKLNDLKESLMTMVTQSKTQSGRRKNVNLNKADLKQLTNIANSNMHGRGGLSLEAIENQIVSTILGDISKVEGVSVGSYRTGASGMKADNIFTIGINSAAVEDIINNKFLPSNNDEKSKRVKNIKKIKELNEKLSGINDGFIIYSSDNNYTINSGFSGRGGFEGNDQSFEYFLDTMELTTNTINKNFSIMLGAIIQSCKGAIKSNNSLDEWRQKIAQDVAFMLFDDFDTIGQEMQSSSANSVHIMNLNGIMLPLSFILFLMSQAVSEGDREIRSAQMDKYVRVNIKLPAILFPDNSYWKDSEGLDKGRSLEEAWKEQRDYAFRDAKITTHFLKDFKQLISEYVDTSKFF